MSSKNLKDVIRAVSSALEKTSKFYSHFGEYSDPEDVRDIHWTIDELNVAASATDGDVVAIDAMTSALALLRRSSSIIEEAGWPMQAGVLESACQEAKSWIAERDVSHAAA